MEIFTSEELEQLKEITQKLKEFVCRMRMDSIDDIKMLMDKDKSNSLEDNEEIEGIYNLIENFYDVMILSYISLKNYLNTKTLINKIDIRCLFSYDRSTFQRLLLMCIKNDLLNVDTSNLRVFINDDYTINSKEYYRKRKELINYVKSAYPTIKITKRYNKRIRSL